MREYSSSFTEPGALLVDGIVYGPESVFDTGTALVGTALVLEQSPESDSVIVYVVFYPV